MKLLYSSRSNSWNS